jgi:lysophospholipid acyltransferase (LPLAT)-like uncharacterized protein
MKGQIMAEKETKKKEKGNLLWFRIARFALPALATGYMKLVDLTSKKIFVNQEYEEETCKKMPFAAATFHQAVPFAAFYIGRYHGVVMVSRSWDGELLAGALHQWGWRTTRGSSSRGGKEALVEMIEIAKQENCPSGLAVDAPRGPAGKVKMGIVILARETGQPVVPFAMWSSRHVQFNSWDKTILPLPFSSIVFAFEKPIRVPQGLEREDYENIRLEIENSISAALVLAQNKVNELKHGKADPALKADPTETSVPRP